MYNIVFYCVALLSWSINRQLVDIQHGHVWRPRPVQIIALLTCAVDTRTLLHCLFSIMGFKCAAYGCKSGYVINTDVDGVTFYSFPADPVLRDQWIRANPRKDFIPTKFSRICSLHFRDCDFIDVRQDSNKSRLKMKSEKPVRQRLGQCLSRVNKFQGPTPATGRNIVSLIRESKIFIKDKTNVACRMSGTDY